MSCAGFKKGPYRAERDIAPYFKELRTWEVWIKQAHSTSMAETINDERPGPWGVGNLRKTGKNFVEEKIFVSGLEGWCVIDG